MEYKSLDKYELKGRGTVYIIENEVERDRSNNDLLNSDVTIDGVKHKVKGVESFALPIIRKGPFTELEIGLSYFGLTLKTL
jgi:hypothetical protein